MPKILQDEISDRDFVIVIMSGGRMYVLDGEISDEILLGVSPLSKYFTEKHLTTLIKCHTQGDHSDPSTESEQPQLGEHSDPSTQGDESVQGNHSDLSMEGDQPQLGDHSDPSTEGDESVQGDHSDPSTEGDQPQLGEHSDPSTQGDESVQGDHSDPSMEGDQPPLGEHSILDVLHKHDSSFELDELDQEMMKLDMNGKNSDSPGTVSLSLEYEDLYENSENSSAVVYIESVHGDNQLIASESSDNPASDTEVTYDSDLMSVLDNSKSETSDNKSNQSSEVVPPSVFEYDDDNMIQLDESGNSSIISYQMARSHAVEPAKDSEQSLSDGELCQSGNVNSVPHAVETAKDSVQSLSDGEVCPSGNVNSVPHAVETAKDSVQSDGELYPSGNVNSVPHAVEPAKDSVQSDGEVCPSGNVNSVPHAVEPAKDSVQSDGEVCPSGNVNSVLHAVEPANEIDKSSNPEKFPPVAEMNVNRQTCEKETEKVSSSEDDFFHVKN